MAMDNSDKLMAGGALVLGIAGILVLTRRGASAATRPPGPLTCATAPTRQPTNLSANDLATFRDNPRIGTFQRQLAVLLRRPSIAHDCTWGPVTANAAADLLQQENQYAQQQAALRQLTSAAAAQAARGQLLPLFQYVDRLYAQRGGT